MNFLNFSNYNDRPVLKYILIGLVALNAVILALLVLGPRFFPSKTEAKNLSASDSPGYTVGWENYSGSTVQAAEQEVEAEEEEEGPEKEAADAAGTSSTEFTAEEEEEGEGEMPSSGPLLELVDDHVTLHVGDYFNFYEYIKTMQDRDGRELSRYIHLTGNVNTSVPGDYLITYRITSQVDGVSASADLLVTVVEED